MTKINGEASENTDAGNNEYLYEPYTTADGLEVPPPTRPMGPRRLARYRDDVAAYLRARRDGKELPEEPVAYMPALARDQGIAEKELAVQRKFAALSTLGDIKAPDAENDLLDTGNDQRGDATVVNTAVDAKNTDFAPADTGYAPTDTDFVPADTGYAAPTEANFVPADAPAEAEDPFYGPTVSRDVSTDINIGGDVIVDEDFGEVSLTASGDVDATEELLLSNTALKKALRNETPGVPPTEQFEIRLPIPVSAMDAQGLDLSQSDFDDDEYSSRISPWNTASQPVVSDQTTAIEGRDVLASSIRSHDAERKSVRHTSANSMREPIEEEKSSAFMIWLALLLVVALVGIVFLIIL